MAVFNMDPYSNLFLRTMSDGPSPTTGEHQRKDGEWRNTRCTALHCGFESASATHRSWNVTVGDGRLPRQSLIGTHPATFSYGSLCSNSNHCRTSMHHRKAGEHTLFHEQGNNRLISLLLALGVITAELGHCWIHLLQSTLSPVNKQRRKL